MPKVSPIQTNFNAGEISPLMYGRVELDAYKNALATCLNCIPLIQGGVTRRPGTYWCDEVKDSSKATRAVKFKFSTTQAYVIEFGHLYVRFKRNNAPVLETGKVITGATQANPVVLTSVAHGFLNGENVDVSAVLGMTQLNGRRFRVANKTADTFELTDLGGVNVNGTAFGAYTSGGLASRVYTVVTPYTEADLFQLKFTQSADVLYIDHPGYEPRKLSRTAHTSWTLNTIVFLDGPYMTANATATTLTPSAATGAGITITASAVTGINGDAGFASTDVGRLIRIKQGSVWGYVRIVGWTSTTVVTADVINTLTDTTAKVNWRLGLWSATTGYPAAPMFHDDRLAHGGNTSQQQRLDGSRTGDYENMAPSDTDGTVTDSHAISFTLNSDDVQVIRWMKTDEKGLLTGTVEGEWVVRPSTTAQALSPTNVNAKQSTPHGSTNSQAIRVGKTILYIQKAGRKLRELAYVYQDDGFYSPDKTYIAEHITKGPTPATSGLKEIEWQQEPQSIIWGPRNDGALLGFLYERDEKVAGWHRHALGGFSNAAKTAAPVVESVTVIPSADGTRDEVWMVVKRFINGRTVRYFEFMTKMWERGNAQKDGIYGDCALTYNGDPVTTITGLFHLAGETVSVLIDGATHPDVVVSATGTITLNQSASVVQVGYKYNSDVQMLRQEAGAADGTAQGKLQRAHRVMFRFHDTGPVKVGANFNSSGSGKLTTIPFRTSTDPTATAVPLFFGDQEVSWDGDYSTETYFCWRWDTMLPGTVLAVMPHLHTQDR